MEQKIIKSKIKELMKKYGFKNTGDFFFKHVGDNFVIVVFSVGKSLTTYVSYKKYSYDDINWRMHNLEELSSKGDSQRILGAHMIPSIPYRKYKDEYASEGDLLSAVSSRIDHILSVDLPDIETTNVNIEVINGDYSNKLKCLALIDSGRVVEAISLAGKCIENGEDGDETFWGQTFFELLVNVYSDKTALKNNDSYNERNEAFISSPSEIYDNIEWHYDSAQKAYTEAFGEYNLELVDINRYAGAHMVYFLTWLILNDALEKATTNEIRTRTENVKNKIESPTDILLDCFDGKLLRSDIDPKYIQFVDSYFENEYISDYSNMLLGYKENAYISEFTWDRYNKIEPIIDKRYNSFRNKT